MRYRRVLMVGCLLTGWICFAASGETAAGEGDQLRFLPGPGEKTRFATPEISWPEKVGEAEVCLWADDKVAAFSFTIDDNSAPDHDWWIQKAKEYDFKATWFVITRRVGTGVNWGTWADFQKLLDEGHDVQSHTVTHLHSEEPDWVSLEWEYGDSIKHIEEGLPGHRVTTLAYPGGTQKNNRVSNDPKIAMQHYLAARGTRGTPNPPGEINYTETNGATGFNLGEGEKGKWGDLNNLLNPEGYRDGQFYRGWAVMIDHKVNRQDKERFFKWMDEHREELWVGLFRDVARYGQERDTAQLTVTDSSDTSIVFELRDRMYDEWFDYPLTVKVRLPDGWQNVSAKQGDAPVESRMLSHEGKPYALVQAVPDRGPVTVEPSTATSRSEPR